MTKYLIALEIGGLHEQPRIGYCNFEVVIAETMGDAVREYNKKHGCNFYYGTCMAYLDNSDSDIVITNKNVTYKQAEMLKNL